nr:PREDICTED: retinol dehydrogenase 7-like isoform X1 [Lepisosteus oculatus]
MKALGYLIPYILFAEHRLHRLHSTVIYSSFIKAMDKDIPSKNEIAENESCLDNFIQAVISNPVLSSILVSSLILFAVWYIRDSLKIDHVDQKSVLVTGCDSGFGNLLARQLDHRGFGVIATCLTEKGAEDLRAAASPRLKTLLLNVTDSASIERALEYVRAEVVERGLWGLVNNAGVASPIGPTDWMQVEDFKNVLDINLMGLIEVTLKFLPLVKKARGRVVNVGSVMGRLAMTGGGYCLSKWGVESFSDSLRRDMYHFDINVSIIEPGFFKTGVTSLEVIERDLLRLWNCLPSEVKDSYGDKYYEEYVKAQSISMKLLRSSDISKVTNCMEHALTARYPRTRYGVGWDAKLLWLPLSYGPSFVSDSLISALLPSPKGKIVQTNQVDVSKT